MESCPRSTSANCLDMVQVNCSAVVHLTRLYLPEMMKRHSGDVLILASTASFQAVPYISTYAATKAFDLLFAEGLAEEMKPHGIRVCALCPGSTESEFHAVAGQEKFARKAETAEKVARTGLTSAGRRQKLRDFRIGKLSWRAGRASGAAADGHAHCRWNVQTAQGLIPAVFFTTSRIISPIKTTPPLRSNCAAKGRAVFRREARQ